MENVPLTRHERHQLFDEKSLTRYTRNPEENVTYFVNNTKLYSFGDSDVKPKCLHDYEPSGGQFEAPVVSINFISSDQVVQLFFENGRVINFDLYGGQQGGHVLNLSGPIEHVKYSHDQELLTMVADRRMYLFNKLFLLKAEYNLLLDEYGAGEQVNVNWGSKETQFHGQGMRDKREGKSFEFQPLNFADDLKSTLDWRGDDKYFVVNMMTSKDFRILKIFNRQGTLMHTSEYIAGLERLVAWKPSGSLIACSQITSFNHRIVFFETNGLFRSDFELTYKSHQFVLEHLLWSPDSKLLAVLGREAKCLAEFRDAIQTLLVYTCANAVWYLKQKFVNNPLLYSPSWDDFGSSALAPTSYRLRAIDEKQNCVVYQFRQSLSLTSAGTSLVINGRKLLVNTFQNSVVPPPYSNYEICFVDTKTQILQVATNDHLLVLVLSGDRIAVFEQTQSPTIKNLQTEELQYVMMNMPKDLDTIYQLVYVKEVVDASSITNTLLSEDDTLYGVITNGVISFNCKTQQLEVNTNLYLPLNLVQFSKNSLVFSNRQSKFFLYNKKTSSIAPYERCNLKDLLGLHDNIERVLVHQDNEATDEVAQTLVLTSRGALYATNQLISSSLVVNSVMLYYQRYLLFTSTDGLFHCWPLAEWGQFKSFESYNPRPIEKGAKLVGFSVPEAKVVLQMVRGNLEAFYPIAMLLDQVDQYLVKCEFLKAFDVLRRSRINLNYIIDYNPQLFEEHCRLFIQQIGADHADWISLFLTELSDIDYFAKLRKNTKAEIDGKQNRIAQLLFDEMKALDPKLYLHQILHTFTRLRPANIGGALRMIKSIAEAGERDAAIHFFLYIVSADRIFDEALGTYDFDILLMIASKTNKDPKEYVALVNEFKAIEDETYRKYRIDLHLKRYTKALENLSKCEDRFDEVLELVEKRHLYKEAISAFQLNNEQNSFRYKAIWEIYANYLFSKKYYHEAAMAQRRGGNWAEALKLYQMAGDWNMAIVCAQEVAGDRREEFDRLVRLIAQQLALNGDHLNGGCIYEHYLGDHREALTTFTKGHCWARALRAARYGKLEVAELEQALLKHQTTVLELAKEYTDGLVEHQDRLKVLKEERETWYTLHGNREPENFDTYSDTSSLCSVSSTSSAISNSSGSSQAGSIMSLKTNRSSSRAKIKRKREGRRYLLKVGSPNEDIQRIYAIKEVITACLRTFAEAKELVAMLYELYHEDESSQLQGRLQGLHQLVLEVVKFVWDTDHFTSRIAEDETLKTAPAVPNTVDWKLAFN